MTLQTDYTYDAAGNRTTRVHTPNALQKTEETYSYAAASNRLEQRQTQPYLCSGGNCTPWGAPTTDDWTYTDSGNADVSGGQPLACDSADRFAVNS